LKVKAHGSFPFFRKEDYTSDLREVIPAAAYGGDGERQMVDALES
jgi:hypothetical protein